MQSSIRSSIKELLERQLDWLYRGARVCVVAGLLGCSIGFGQTPINQNHQPNPQSQISEEDLRHLSLAKATELLIAHNLSVAAARYNVDAVRAQRIAAELRPRPTLTFSATQFAIPRVFLHPSTLGKTSSDNVAANTVYTLEVDQLIERGNKRQLRTTQAELNAQAAEAQLKDSLRQQVFQLRQAFLAALLARENLRIVKENLEHFNSTERVLFVQVKEGYSAGVDLKRVQLQQLQFQSDVTTSEQGYEQSLRDVFNLIGAGDATSFANSPELTRTGGTPSATPGLDGSLNVIDGSLEIIPTLLWIDDLRQMALANRPDIRAAEISLQAAQKGVELAEAQRARDVTVGAQYSRTGSDNTTGLVVSVPLQTRRFANSATAQALATRHEAEAQLRLVKTQALTEVEKAFTAYNASRERLRLFTGGALNTATDVRRIEEIAYRDGGKGLLDYLDAQRAFNQTLLGYNQARYDFLLSLYQLEFATGTTLVK